MVIFGLIFMPFWATTPGSKLHQEIEAINLYMDVLDFIVALIVGDSTPPSDSVILTEKERNMNA